MERGAAHSAGPYHVCAGAYGAMAAVPRPASLPRRLPGGGRDHAAGSDPSRAHGLCRRARRRPGAARRQRGRAPHQVAVAPCGLGAQAPEARSGGHPGRAAGASRGQVQTYCDRPSHAWAGNAAKARQMHPALPSPCVHWAQDPSGRAHGPAAAPLVVAAEGLAQAVQPLLHGGSIAGQSPPSSPEGRRTPTGGGECS